MGEAASFDFACVSHMCANGHFGSSVRLGMAKAFFFPTHPIPVSLAVIGLGSGVLPGSTRGGDREKVYVGVGLVHDFDHLISQLAVKGYVA